MFRRVDLPGGLPGGLCLDRMPGRYEPFVRKLRIGWRVWEAGSGPETKEQEQFLK